MSGAKHTPGPWQARPILHTATTEYIKEGEPNGEWEVFVEDATKPTQGEPWFIAVVCDGAPGSTEANARLIAAAPELLEACESAIPEGVCLTNRNIPDGFKVALDCTMGDLRKIAAAIAKARGDA